jgi:hypothetical protein
MIVSINIPDAIAPTVVDNICAATNWTAGSGQTKAQWAKTQVINHVIRLNTAGAQKLASASAQSSIVANPIT